MIIVQQASNIRVFGAEDLGFWAYNSDTDITTEQSVGSGTVHSWEGDQLSGDKRYVGFEARIE